MKQITITIPEKMSEALTALHADELYEDCTEEQFLLNIIREGLQGNHFEPCGLCGRWDHYNNMRYRGDAMGFICAACDEKDWV